MVASQKVSTLRYDKTRSTGAYDLTCLLKSVIRVNVYEAISILPVDRRAILTVKQNAKAREKRAGEDDQA